MNITNTTKISMLSTLKSAIAASTTNPAKLEIYGDVNNADTLIATANIQEVTDPTPADLTLHLNPTPGNSDITAIITWGGGSAGDIATVTSFAIKTNSNDTILTGTVGTSPNDDITFSTDQWEFNNTIDISNLGYRIA